MNDKFFSLLKEKRAFQIQSRIFNFINDPALQSRIIKKEDITKSISTEIEQLSSDFKHLFRIDTDFSISNLSGIQACFESVISKSLHNSIISSYETDDVILTGVISKIKETCLIQKVELEKFFGLNHLFHHISEAARLSQLEAGGISELGIILLKFKNDFYFYQGVQEKLHCIKALVNSITSLLKMVYKSFDIMNKQNYNLMVKFIAFGITKVELQRVNSNIQFIKTCKMIELIATEDHFHLYILQHSVKFLKEFARKKFSGSKKSKTPQKKDSFFEPSQNINSVFDLDNTQINAKELGNTTDSDSETEFMNLPESSINNIELIQAIGKVDDAILQREPLSPNLGKSKGHHDCMQSIVLFNTEKIKKRYFDGNFNELNTSRFESMQSDFKILLKMIESIKVEVNIDS